MKNCQLATPLFTHIYLSLPVLPYFTLFTHVYPCLLVFTLAYSQLHVITHVLCLPLNFFTCALHFNLFILGRAKSQNGMEWNGACA